MSTTTRTIPMFVSNVWGDGIRQLFIWCLIVFLLILAWNAGRLQTVCLIVIGGLTLYRVFVDYFRRFASMLTIDAKRSAEEFNELKSVSADQIKELATIDTRGTGSLFQIISAIAKYSDRASKEVIVRRHLKVLRESLEAALQPVQDAVQKCPMLGLGGSLLGMLSALHEFSIGGDPAAVSAGMSMMVSTTLAGCAAALSLLFWQL